MSWVENELGRYRFKENWEALKASGKARDRIARWLDVTNVNGNPDELVQILDRYAAGYSGRWR